MSAAGITSEAEYSAVLGVEPTVHQQYRCHAVYIVDVLVFTRVFTLLELLVSMGSVVIVSSFVVSDLLV